MTVPKALINGLTHRIVQVPVRSLEDPTPDRRRVVTTLVSAHSQGRAISVAWVRTRAHGPVIVLVGGFDGGAGAEAEPLGFPPGALARRSAEAASVLGSLGWSRCALSLDASSVQNEALGDRIEDIFRLDPRPMGFLAVGVPLMADEVSAVIEPLSDEVARLEALRGGLGADRRQFERTQANLTYYDQVAALGCWRLSLWVGAPDAAGGAATGALLAGTSDLAESVAMLSPLAPQALGGPLTWGESLVVGPDAAAALIRPPFEELPGIRTRLQTRFDQNLESAVDLPLGSILDGTRSQAAPFGASLEGVNRHVFVCGATGSGKSETVRTLLVELAGRGVPWLAIEPAKSEYSAVAPWLAPDRGLVVIRPGDPDHPPPMLNPLEPSSITVNGIRHTFPLQTHLDMVRALFTASFDADEPFPQVLGAGLTRAYQARGWNLVSGRPADPSLPPPHWPVLADLVRESLDVVDGLGYGPEVRQNVRGFIRVRIESLRMGTPGRFFEGGFPLDLDDLLTRPAVFEIEDLGDDNDKAFFIGNLIIRIAELLRLRGRFLPHSTSLRHVLVIEEAHRLLRRVAEDSPSAHAVTMFANLLAEIRAYGEGVVVAEQIPSKVIPDLVKNSAIKVMHRLPALDDRDAVGSTMNLNTEQSSEVVALEPGEAAAHIAGMDRPVLVRMDRVSTRRPKGGSVNRPTIASRSPLCSVECAGLACSLSELEAARELVTPSVALWVEQVVLAHLCGDPIGTPRGPWLDRLGATDQRRAHCAINLAVEASCQRRAALIRRWHGPEAFTASVSKRLQSQLQTGRGLGRPPARWSIGQYRYPQIRRLLTDPQGGADRSVPHPSTAEWSARGISLPGPTWTDQLAQLAEVTLVLPQVRPWQIAGTPPVVVELARLVGHHDASDAAVVAQALASLGLEYTYVPARLGLKL